MPIKLEHLKDEILEMHANGMSIHKIAKHFGEYEQAVSTIIKKYGQHKPRTFYNFNVDFFETIDTEEKAYFLGFIAADGCIQNNSSGVMVLSITINNRDIDILERMKEAMKAEQPIIHLKRHNMVRITFTRKKLISDLMKYDLTERKSLTMGPMLHHLSESMKPHFVRGYFDGDGSVYIAHTGYPGNYVPRHYVSFRGTEAFLESFRDYFSIKGSLYFSNGTHQWRFGAKSDVERFRDIIYKDAAVFMSRKHEKFPK